MLCRGVFAAGYLLAAAPALAADVHPSTSTSTTKASSSTTTVTVTTNPVPTKFCEFETLPTTPFAWDPVCVQEGVGRFGCFADDKNHECRFCGKAALWTLPDVHIRERAHHALCVGQQVQAGGVQQRLLRRRRALRVPVVRRRRWRVRRVPDHHDDHRDDHRDDGDEHVDSDAGPRYRAHDVEVLSFFADRNEFRRPSMLAGACGRAHCCLHTARDEVVVLVASFRCLAGRLAG
eukprot:CAMPEP_0183508822 /NCGR_PEP_ID=MMETSP0371-20130417/9146_1 /TAXON_ID=268820 /ORGANISM="Peridinium aciculiferum, Strain PAER-2" /LENGTH=233 /DNA_ID=CAMNT_0025705293 /DNA_START=63 /DNA_END=763 /DNA_ORIENTATION=+